MRPDFDTGAELFFNRVDQPIRRVAEEVGAEAHRDIDVFIVVDVPELGVLGAVGNNRIDHFLPQRFESGDSAGIGVMRTMLGGVGLGGFRFRNVAADQLIERLLLEIGEPAFFALIDRLVRAEAGVGVRVASEVFRPPDRSETIRRRGDRSGLLTGKQSLHELEVVRH